MFGITRTRRSLSAGSTVRNHRNTQRAGGDRRFALWLHWHPATKIGTPIHMHTSRSRERRDPRAQGVRRGLFGGDGRRGHRQWCARSPAATGGRAQRTEVGVWACSSVDADRPGRADPRPSHPAPENGHHPRPAHRQPSEKAGRSTSAIWPSPWCWAWPPTPASLDCPC